MRLDVKTDYGVRITLSRKNIETLLEALNEGMTSYSLQKTLPWEDSPNGLFAIHICMQEDNAHYDERGIA